MPEQQNKFHSQIEWAKERLAEMAPAFAALMTAYSGAAVK